MRLEELERRVAADPEDRAAQAALINAKKRAGRVTLVWRRQDLGIHALRGLDVWRGNTWWMGVCGYVVFGENIDFGTPIVAEGNLEDITCNRCLVSLRLKKTKGGRP